MSGVTQITVAAADGEQRLDRWFKRRFPDIGHGRLEKLLRTGQVRVDGKRAKASDRLEVGQVVRIPPLGETGSEGSSEPGRGEPARGDRAPAKRPPAAPAARDIRMLQGAVLYQDDDVIVINKPAGLAVQGGSGIGKNLDDLLVALQFDAAEKPRLVHRLDRDTSGVLVLARHLQAAQRLADAFRHKDARKIYWAVTVGVPKLSHGKIDAALAKQGGQGRERVQVDDEGKRAVTFYRVLDKVGTKVAWLALMPMTGRTHQLRAHCLALGTPILGDGKYAGAGAFIAREAVPRQLHLHARRLILPHPRKGVIDVTAPLPTHMQETQRFFGFADSFDEDPFADLDI
ncbi:MAG TPA: RluA family pseudouridine synthase [Terriglobia bacterium]|nr:RluA family pseudouridine synthase [Terriglobia bacterium]